eukprot:Skav201489  [mRNA]  locus=scaffold828:266999:268630:- [translate_table: standard]
MAENVTGSTSTPGKAEQCYIFDCQQPAKWRFKCSSHTCPGLTPLAGYGGEPGPVNIRLCQQHRDGDCPTCQKRIERIELQLQSDEVCTMTASDGEDRMVPEDGDGDDIAADGIGEAFSEVADESVRSLCGFECGGGLERFVNDDFGCILRKCWRWQAVVLRRLHRPSLLKTTRGVVEILSMALHFSRSFGWVEQACQDGAIASIVQMLEHPLIMKMYTNQNPSFSIIPATLCCSVIEQSVSLHGPSAKQALDADLFRLVKHVVLPAAVHGKDAGFSEEHLSKMVVEAMLAVACTAVGVAQTPGDHDIPKITFEMKRSTAESLCPMFHLFPETQHALEKNGEELVDLLQFFVPAAFLMHENTSHLVCDQVDPALLLQQPSHQSQDALAGALLQIVQCHCVQERSLRNMHWMFAKCPSCIRNRLRGHFQCRFDARCLQVTMLKKWDAFVKHCRFHKELVKAETLLKKLARTSKRKDIVHRAVYLLIVLMFYDESGLLQETFWEERHALFGHACSVLGVPILNATFMSLSFGRYSSYEGWSKSMSD